MKKIVFLIITVLFFNVLHAQRPIGSYAPDVAFPNENGQVISLSSLKGKVVLLHFWASWCRPCRISNREMASIYKKYNKDGLEILGLSVDGDKKAWLSAVKKDNIKWKETIDVAAAKGDQVMQDWGIQYIPTTYLIDRKGKIIAINPEIRDMDEILKKVL